MFRDSSVFCFWCEVCACVQFGGFLGYFIHNSYCWGLFLPGDKNELCKIWMKLGLRLLPSLGQCSGGSSRRVPCHPPVRVPLPRCPEAARAVLCAGLGADGDNKGRRSIGGRGNEKVVLAKGLVTSYTRPELIKFAAGTDKAPSCS